LIGVLVRRRPDAAAMQQLLTYERVPDEIDVMGVAARAETHHVDLIMNSAIDRTGPPRVPTT
jgi:hypothetical protein